MVELTEELKIAIEVALDEARHRRHEFAGTEHLALALLHDKVSARALRACGAQVGVLRSELESFISESIPALPEHASVEVSPSLGFQHAVQRAVINAQTSERNLIAGPHVLIALFALQDCHAVYLLKRQGITRLDIMEYVSHGGLDYSDDDYDADDDYELEGGDDDNEDLTPAKALEKFSVNLNEEAQEGRIDPMVGRVKELTRTIHILSRRRKNNPVFVGDAGVGKTAIAEGLARAIQQGDVPGCKMLSFILSMLGLSSPEHDIGAFLSTG